MKSLRFLTALALTTAGLALPSPALAQDDRYIGEVMLVGFGYCPTNTMDADGRLLSISSNSALFSLLGTTYGGDGRVTFALPDLRGRHAVGVGQGPGRQNYPQGAVNGSETVTLSTDQMPVHIHSGRVIASTGLASTDNPTGMMLGDFPNGTPVYTAPGSPVQMAPNTIVTDPAGGSRPVDVRDPSLTLRYCVVTQGLFPPRP